MESTTRGCKEGENEEEEEDEEEGGGEGEEEPRNHTKRKKQNLESQEAKAVPIFKLAKSKKEESLQKIPILETKYYRTDANEEYLQNRHTYIYTLKKWIY